MYIKFFEKIFSLIGLLTQMEVLILRSQILTQPVGLLIRKQTYFQEPYSHPIIIMATAKIFSPSVVGAMLPNPMLVRLVMVKYSEVM